MQNYYYTVSFCGHQAILIRLNLFLCLITTFLCRPTDQLHIISCNNALYETLCHAIGIFVTSPRRVVGVVSTWVPFSHRIKFPTTPAGKSYLRPVPPATLLTCNRCRRREAVPSDLQDTQKVLFMQSYQPLVAPWRESRRTLLCEDSVYRENQLGAPSQQKLISGYQKDLAWRNVRFSPKPDPTDPSISRLLGVHADAHSFGREEIKCLFSLFS